MAGALPPQVADFTRNRATAVGNSLGLTQGQAAILPCGTGAKYPRLPVSWRGGMNHVRHQAGSARNPRPGLPDPGHFGQAGCEQPASDSGGISILSRGSAPVAQPWAASRLPTTIDGDGAPAIDMPSCESAPVQANQWQPERTTFRLSIAPPATPPSTPTRLCRPRPTASIPPPRDESDGVSPYPAETRAARTGDRGDAHDGG